jgi:hypothetical protein
MRMRKVLVCFLATGVLLTVSRCGLSPTDKAARSDQQTSGAVDPMYVYWSIGQPCPPWNNVGAYKPSNYSGTAPSITITSAADSGTGTLRNALAQAAAGATIAFSPDLADSTIKLKSQLVVKKQVVIDGIAAYGITIDGQAGTRIFDVYANGNATFIGLRLIRGKAVGGGNSPGGAISTGNGSSLTIRYCAFERDTADIGGAVRAGYETRTTIEDCTFFGNSGERSNNGFSAGAVSTYGHGDLVIKRSLFVRNTGYVGAAVYNLLEPVLLENCVFMGNRSSTGGAALFTDEGNWGGDSTRAGGHIIVRHCWMEDNLSHEEGGALMLWAFGRDTVIIEKSIFRNDTILNGGQWGASRGGAARARGILSIRECTFMGCISLGQGGALWLDGDGPIDIVNCTFYRNRVTDDQGGAMTLNVGTTVKRVSVTNCTFSENFSQRACGLMWMGNPTLPVTFTHCVSVNNRAGTDHTQDQVGYQPIDGGGNIEYPSPAPGANKVAQGSVVKDPLLDSLAMSNGFLVLPLKSGSPAVGIAVSAKAPSADERGVARDQSPDAGAFEYSANDNSLSSCKATSTEVIR